MIRRVHLLDIEDILLEPGTEALSKFDCRFFKDWMKERKGIYLMTAHGLKDTREKVTEEVLRLFDGYFVSSGRAYYEGDKKKNLRTVASKSGVIEVLAESLSIDPSELVVYCKRAEKMTNPVYKKAMKMGACVRLVRSRNETFDFIMNNYS